MLSTTILQARSAVVVDGMLHYQYQRSSDRDGLIKNSFLGLESQRRKAKPERKATYNLSL